MISYVFFKHSGQKGKIFLKNLLTFFCTFISNPMPAQSLELILARQFGDSLNLPVFLVDKEGNLLFYNDPAEQVFGLRFSDTGGMRIEEWATVFVPRDKEGALIPQEKLTLVITLTEKRPSSGDFYIDSLDGRRIELSVSTFPILGRSNHFYGAMAIFWKKEKV